MLVHAEGHHSLSLVAPREDNCIPLVVNFRWRVSQIRHGAIYCPRTASVKPGRMTPPAHMNLVQSLALLDHRFAGSLFWRLRNWLNDIRRGGKRHSASDLERQKARRSPFGFRSCHRAGGQEQPGIRPPSDWNHDVLLVPYAETNGDGING